jgi:hypothetical protein
VYNGHEFMHQFRYGRSSWVLPAVLPFALPQ